MATSSDDGGRFYAIPDGDAGDPVCDHDAVSGLGGDGGLNGYFECSSCECVLVRDGGGFAGDGATDDLGTVDPRLEDLLEDIEAYHDGRRSPFEAAPPETVFDRLAGALRRLIP